MSQDLVPLWGSKNEVVAPKWRFQNTIFGAVLEFVIKFAILVLNIKHQNDFFPEHPAPKYVLHLDMFSTQMAFCQNTFMWRAPKWHLVRTLFIFVIFRCQDGYRPNLIGSHERAFHMDSKSGLNSKMVIGTQMTFTQNTADGCIHCEIRVFGLFTPFCSQSDVMELNHLICCAHM